MSSNKSDVNSNKVLGFEVGKIELPKSEDVKEFLKVDSKDLLIDKTLAIPSKSELDAFLIKKEK